MSVNQIHSSIRDIHSIAVLAANIYDYCHMSHEEKRNVKANVTFSTLFATTFATTTIATGIFGTCMAASVFSGTGDAFFGPALVFSMGAGILSMTVAIPGNLSISYLVSNYLTNKVFPQPQQKIDDSFYVDN